MLLPALLRLLPGSVRAGRVQPVRYVLREILAQSIIIEINKTIVLVQSLYLPGQGP